jgi:hypothetical protein
MRFSNHLLHVDVMIGNCEPTYFLLSSFRGLSTSLHVSGQVPLFPSLGSSGSPGASRSKNKRQS